MKFAQRTFCGEKSSCSTRPMNVENSSVKTFVIYFLNSGANLCRLKCQKIFCPPLVSQSFWTFLKLFSLFTVLLYILSCFRAFRSKRKWEKFLPVLSEKFRSLKAHSVCWLQRFQNFLALDSFVPSSSSVLLPFMMDLH